MVEELEAEAEDSLSFLKKALKPALPLSVEVALPSFGFDLTLFDKSSKLSLFNSKNAVYHAWLAIFNVRGIF